MDPESQWFLYTIIFTALYGGVNFMYKLAAHHNCKSHKIVNISALTITILSFSLILITGSEFLNIRMIFLFAIINSSFFALGSIVKIQSLKFIPSSYAFPVTKMNAVFLIVYALVLFNENPTALQWTGIGISFAMLLYVSLSVNSKNGNKAENKRQVAGLLLALLAAFSTSISMLTGKFASTEVPKINYIFISYSFVFIYTSIINRFRRKQSDTEASGKGKMFITFGIIIGILNFSGYYLLLSAFETGPLSLIQGISSNSFIIPVILSVLFLKEPFKLKNAVVIMLSVISILLIKIDF